MLKFSSTLLMNYVEKLKANRASLAVVRFPVSIVLMCATALSTLALNATAADKERFQVLVGFAKPPYVIQDTRSGFELELIEQVMAMMDIEVRFVFVPFGRSVRLLHSHNVDALLTVSRRNVEDHDFFSDVYVIYQNVVITRKDAAIQPESIDDLAKLRIVSFQTANKVLGEHFANAVAKSPKYQEVYDQKLQTKMLIERDTDAIVMDVNIFKSLSAIVGGEPDFSDVNIHYFFEKSPYQVAFKQERHIAPFNQALAKFMASPNYQALLDKYQLEQ